MNNNLPVPGQMRYDTKTLKIQFFDGTNWEFITSLKPLQNDLKPTYIWKRKFAFLPHRCELSGNRVWLKYAMRGEPTYEWTLNKQVTEIWHDEFEHTNWLIING